MPVYWEAIELSGSSTVRVGFHLAVLLPSAAVAPTTGVANGCPSNGCVPTVSLGSPKVVDGLFDGYTISRLGRWPGNRSSSTAMEPVTHPTTAPRRSPRMTARRVQLWGKGDVRHIHPAPIDFKMPVRHTAEIIIDEHPRGVDRIDVVEIRGKDK